ncbi:MAG TPA: aspartyl protease family protein, partial [Pyrinomonadaceae bacterium]
TGASISVVSRALSERAGFGRYAQTGFIKVYGAAGLADNIQTVLLPRLTLGTYTWQNIHAAVLDMEAINETAGFEQTGIVGGNILRRYRVTFDFARGVIRLDPDPRVTPQEDPRGRPAVVSGQS